ncbi:PspA/IM30 family protein [Paenibacillus wynnii]|uniref:Phage-shock protein n=1 Tax=Paenibacillus wynnii TaxID=268407 RepID=A0A098MA15_9BACL|nr:PspA/IM30 family protein [Paenibacillus wynnii]KGE18893.1 hypothetical protein PWYN_05645 [Paenibacillus wynnii]
MSILQRIATLTKAALHEGLNKLEDPMLLTGQYLRDLEEEIATAERNERDFKVAASVLERRKHEYQLMAEQSEILAVQAIEQGNEPEAKLAVQAKLKFMESEQECTVGLEETRHTLSTLEISIRNAKEERTRLKAKREELAARARQAKETLHKTPRNIGQNPGKGNYGHALNTGETSRGFERMEEKITELETHAENSQRNFHSTSSPAVDPSLNTAVDAEMARLRSLNNVK